jgi:hypothetical protein
MFFVCNLDFKKSSFGATEIRQGYYLLTFKVQGQVNHLPVLYYPVMKDPNIFLNIFHG